MKGSNDPFPTMKLNVPYLQQVLDTLRDAKAEYAIIILHVADGEEGEWILANVSARLQRSKIKSFGPEMMRPKEVIEQALITKAPVALLGEIRRIDDAHAMRAAAGVGLHMVGYIAVKSKFEFETTVAELGPWRSVHPLTLSRG